MSDRLVHQIVFRDGVVAAQEEPPIMGIMTVVLDDQMVPVGFALAKLIAERARLLTELDTARTKLADIRAGELHT